MARDPADRTWPKRTRRTPAHGIRRRGPRLTATGRDRPIEVIAVFGPTASGRARSPRRSRTALGTEVVSADAMQVYRGLPILTNQSARPTRLVGIRALDEEMSVGAFAALAHAEIDELVGRAAARSCAGGTGLYLRAALADLDVPPPAGPAMRERIRERGRRRRRRRARAARRARPRGGRRRPPARPPAARARARARRGGTLARRRRPALERRHAASDADRRARPARRTSSSDASASGRTRCSPAASSTRCGARSPDRSRAPPRRRSGSRRSRSLPPDDARERIVVRTRRYAAYQRKWMRRIPGIVVLDGTRRCPTSSRTCSPRVRR